MSFFSDKKRLQAIEDQLHRLSNYCAKLESELETTKKRVAEFDLDYNMLYEKIRVNLAKLAKRAKVEAEDVPPVDDVTKARQLLLERKLNRR